MKYSALKWVAKKAKSRQQVSKFAYRHGQHISQLAENLRKNELKQDQLKQDEELKDPIPVIVY